MPLRNFIGYVVNVSVSPDRLNIAYHDFARFLIALIIISDTFADFKAAVTNYEEWSRMPYGNRARQLLDFFVSF